jgi:hypothetical protein
VSGRGRPLRFLAVVLIGWVGVRVVMLWPPERVPVPSDVPGAVVARRSQPAPVPILSVARTIAPVMRSPAPQRHLSHVERRGQALAYQLSVVPAPNPPFAEPAPPPQSPLAMPEAPPFLPSTPPHPDRWSASGWIAVRGGGSGALAPGGHLGGSQAGFRVAWLAVPRAQLAGFVRLTAPLHGRGREGAVGVEWGGGPVRLVAEQRFGLDGARGGPGLGAVGGIDREVRGVRLEGYGQAGLVLRARAEPYADGAVRGLRTVLDHGPLRIAIGPGAWGAAQRDAQRLDVGPSAVIGMRNLRLTVDWRQRVAGRARPGSGPALTLGGDF